MDPLSTTKPRPSQEDESEVEIQSAEAPTHPDERIHYVDDDEIAREAFADAAIQLGFWVDTADGGGEALTMASRRRYAVIAADLRMPTLNGLSLIQLLRPKWPDATYLIVTGASHLDLPSQANGEPLVDEIVSKPWTLSQLAKILKRAVDRARARQSDGSAKQPQDLPILVVEDDPENVTILRKLMAESLPDTHCVHAQGLSHAIEMLAERAFRLAVVDLELADSGGLETVLSLRRTVPELPLVVLGVLDDELVQNQVFKAGAQDYLVKSRLDEYNLRRSVRYALKRKHLEDRLTFLSQSDRVTGLSNRASLLQDLGRAVSRARSQDAKVAVLLLDLDRFKIVNDSLGHDMGVRLLKVVADRLRENLRDVDIAARLGGDEFAIPSKVYRATTKRGLPHNVCWRRSHLPQVSTTTRSHRRAVSASRALSRSRGIGDRATPARRPRHVPRQAKRAGRLRALQRRERGIPLRCVGATHVRKRDPPRA